MSDATRLLGDVAKGDEVAAGQLLPLIYDELRRIAAHKMAREQPGHTLQPTALVHEAWLRLIGKEGEAHFANRAHFFAAAAEAMRRILVERARRKLAAKRGGGQVHEDVDELAIAAPERDDELLAVHEALDRLAEADPAKAQLVKLRYFVGMTIEEAAQVLDISEPTAKRWWAYARAWLYREIGAGPQTGR
jgi:RNA polymerase sigma factor (TIGR02999 family)